MKVLLLALVALICASAVHAAHKPHDSDKLPGWKGEMPGQNKPFSAAEFVEAALTSHKAVIFSKSYCPYCRRAKQTLSQVLGEGGYKAIELDQMAEGREIQGYLGELTGASTVPRIFFGGEFYGGGDYTQAAAQNGSLQKHLKSLNIAVKG